MKKWILRTLLAAVMTTLMLTPALALEYNISAPDDPLYAPATSVDEVIVVGGSSEWDNIDRSKNTAIVPPPFGSPESYQLGTGVTLNVPTYSGTSGVSTIRPLITVSPPTPATSSLFLMDSSTQTAASVHCAFLPWI